MSLHRHKIIADKAREILIGLYQREHEISPFSLKEFLADAPELICREILKVRVERVAGLSYLPPGQAISEPIGGYVSREKNLICIEAREPLNRQRFTLAHEIGHWVLHPHGEHFRDSVIQKLAHHDPKRALEEREADAFAAELLMPAKTIRNEFERRFPDISENLIYAWDFWHQLPDSSRNGSVNQFCQSRYRRAMTMAGLRQFQNCNFLDLAGTFSVSREAMARRLMELKLVA